ncbi:patatin-like phospholipase family protein [Ascidiimonas aurantiaca]|uniref:patatin-like phospholipase family protein n=1 Tax=Ascidiimonas aurantiaca TaxID=1685432 RepID=UPI0030ED3964
MSLKTTTGLVLSGGGYRGVAHIGVIKALEEHGVFPEVISGTSAGALVGALYANGNSYQEMLEFFRKVKIFTLSRFSRRKPGFVDTDSFYDFLKGYFPHNKFEALQKKLFVTTTNLSAGEITIFKKGELIPALLASASFPGVFSPVTMDGVLYADGGILDNFPVAPLQNNCDIIYGVDVSPLKNMSSRRLNNFYNILERAYHLRMFHDSKQKFAMCDVVINPPELGKYSVFNNTHIDLIFDIGYRATCETLKSKPVERIT